MKDLILLVADKNAEYALKGALSRPEALEIASIQFEIDVHPGRDGGARKTGPETLSLRHPHFRHALLIFDFEGCGTDLPDAIALEAELDARLTKRWQGAAKSIVIEPELDVWLWGADNAIETGIGWAGGTGVREWLREKGFSFGPNSKPARPKEAIEAALRQSGLPRSSAFYRQIAQKIGLRKCRDEAFQRLRHQLREWFPR